MGIAIATAEFRMNIPTKTPRLFAIALLAMSSAVVSAQRNSAAAEKGKSATPAVTAREKAKTEADAAKQKAHEQRDAMLAEYEALARQLKDATAEQRKQILDRIEQQKKAFEQAQSALHKQIRDEQRRQRQNPAPKR
jgi:Skp family chaperone for outer membrane proteins